MRQYSYLKQFCSDWPARINDIVITWRGYMLSITRHSSQIKTILRICNHAAEEKENKFNDGICSIGLQATTRFFVRAMWFKQSAPSALVPGGVISVVLTCAPPRQRRLGCKPPPCKRLCVFFQPSHETPTRWNPGKVSHFKLNNTLRTRVPESRLPQPRCGSNSLLFLLFFYALTIAK